MILDYVIELKELKKEITRKQQVEVAMHYGNSYKLVIKEYEKMGSYIDNTLKLVGDLSDNIGNRYVFKKLRSHVESQSSRRPVPALRYEEFAQIASDWQHVQILTQKLLIQMWRIHEGAAA